MDEPHVPAQPWHGTVTCVAEAHDVDAALACFERLIRRLHEEDELLEHATRVYLDACVEVRSVPRAGFLSYCELREGEDLGRISTAIRGATDDEAVAFRFGGPDEDEAESEHMATPFLAFGASRRRGHVRRSVART